MTYSTVSITIETKKKLKIIKEWEGIETFDELMLGFIELYKVSKSQEDKHNASQK